MMTVLNFSCLLLFIRLFFSSYCWYIVPLYLIWYSYDRETPFKAGRNFALIRNFFLWRYLASYFPIKLHKTCDLDPSKNYIFAFHPHGVFVFGGLTNFASNGTGFDEMFPGLTIHFTFLNGQFTFPFYRDYIIASGFTPSDGPSIDFKLSKLGPGHSVVIIVGGAAEMTLSAHTDVYMLKLKNRKGFVRRALKNRASVVPVFSFNETRVYDMMVPEVGSWTYYIAKFIKFVTSLTIPLAYGLKYCGHLVPKRHPIDTVVGAPLDFAEFRSALNDAEDPPEDIVDKCYETYIAALTKLYDENKARFGDENTPLVFV